MGRAICSRVSILEWSIPPYNPRQRYTHNANQRQILEEILSLKGSSYDQVNITPLIKTFRPRCLEEHQRKASFFLQWITSQSISVGLIERSYIMMHDVNIKEETKCETSVLALLLF